MLASEMARLRVKISCGSRDFLCLVKSNITTPFPIQESHPIKEKIYKIHLLFILTRHLNVVKLKNKQTILRYREHKTIIQLPSITK